MYLGLSGVPWSTDTEITPRVTPAEVSLHERSYTFFGVS